MIDLTPLDVRKKRGDFRRILRGYDPEEVDSFLELVGERMEELVKENLLLSDRGARLERNVAALEQRENAVQEALVTAQKLRSDVQEQSRREAEVLKDEALREVKLLRAEAEADVARRLAEVDGLLQDRRRALEELERSRRKFLKSFRGLLERELDTVEVEEARAPLEEVTLELEFHGWVPAGGGREEVEAIGGEGSGEEPEDVTSDPGEPALEGAPNEPVPEAAEEDPAEDGLYDSPERPVREPDPGAGAPPAGQQPDWLFSLLKREREPGSEDDV